MWKHLRQASPKRSGTPMTTSRYGIPQMEGERTDRTRSRKILLFSIRFWRMSHCRWNRNLTRRKVCCCELRLAHNKDVDIWHIINNAIKVNDLMERSCLMTVAKTNLHDTDTETLYEKKTLGHQEDHLVILKERSWGKRWEDFFPEEKSDEFEISF